MPRKRTKSLTQIARSSEMFTHTATGQVFHFNQLGNVTLIVKADSNQILATLIDGEPVDEIWNPADTTNGEAHD